MSQDWCHGCNSRQRGLTKLGVCSGCTRSAAWRQIAVLEKIEQHLARIAAALEKRDERRSDACKEEHDWMLIGAVATGYRRCARCGVRAA